MVVLRSALTSNGVLYVMMDGTIMMLEHFVDNWAIMVLIYTIIMHDLCN